MLRIAQYHGTSKISRAIKFLTRSDVSHTAVICDAPYTHHGSHGTRLIEAGNVIEAWDSGVRLVKNISDQHSPGTPVDIYSLRKPLNIGEYQRAMSFLCSQLDKPYNWLDVFRFVSRRPGRYYQLDPAQYPKWFCSCLGFATLAYGNRQLFEHTEPWEVFPGLVHRSVLFDPNCERTSTE